MKTGFFLTARLGSSRLPRKHLLEAGGMAFIAHLIARIEAAFAAEIAGGDAEIVIVTSDEAENRAFEQFARQGVRVFYGSKQNIPLRHSQAAAVLGLDIIIAVDGDDILCSTAAMRKVRDGLVGGDSYAKTSGLPLGMNAFGYRRDFLDASLAAHRTKVLETGWGYIFDEGYLVDYPMTVKGAAPDNLRFTLDYDEDHVFFRTVIENLGSRAATATDDEIVDNVVRGKLFEITDPISKKYWENFHAVKQAEMSSNDSSRGAEAAGKQ